MKVGYYKMYFTKLLKFFSISSRYLYLQDCKRNGMKIGKNLRIMSGVDFGSEPYLISIGNNVVISVGVLFSTHDGGASVIRNIEDMKNKRINTLGEINVGNNVFIGARAIILPNISIGDNVIIAAGAIVSKDIPSNTVFAGVPAKQIMTMEEYRNKLYINNRISDK